MIYTFVTGLLINIIILIGVLFNFYCLSKFSTSFIENVYNISQKNFFLFVPLKPLLINSPDESVQVKQILFVDCLMFYKKTCFKHY